MGLAPQLGHEARCARGLALGDPLDLRQVVQQHARLVLLRLLLRLGGVHGGVTAAHLRQIRQTATLEEVLVLELK